MTVLGPVAQAFYDRIAEAYSLDPISEAVLLAAAEALDDADNARAGADPATPDGRRRLAQARQARSAHVVALRALKSLGVKPKKPSRLVAPTPDAGGPDPREALG